MLHGSFIILSGRNLKLNTSAEGRQVLPEKDYRFVRRTMVSLVLGTDMALHSEIVKACSLLLHHHRT